MVDNRSSSLHSSSCLNSKGKGKGRDSGIGIAENEENVDGGRGEAAGSRWSVWSVLWREPQARKHKTWDADGTLLIPASGLAVLRDESGKVISTGPVRPNLESGDEIKLGSKDVQLEDALDYSEYLRQFGGIARAPSACSSSSQVLSSSAPKIRLPSAIVPLRAPRSAPLPAPAARAPSFAKPLPLPTTTFKKFVPLVVKKAVPTHAAREKARSTAKLEDEVRKESVEPPPRKIRKVVTGESDEDELEAQNEDHQQQDQMSSSPPPPVLKFGIGGARKKPWEDMEALMDRENGVACDHEPLRSSQSTMTGEDVLHRGDAKSEGEDEIVSNAPRVLSPVTTTALSNPQTTEVVGPHYYLCQWRKPTHKKHITWEGDGVLVIDGKKATLKDRDTARDLANCTTSGARFAPGDPVTVGSKLVEVSPRPNHSDAVAYADAVISFKIESVLDEQEFLDGSIFRKGAPTASKPFKIPALAGSFQKFVDPRLNHGPSLSSGGVPRPKFDPKAKGAIVMRRPDKDVSAKYNKKVLPIVDVVLDPILGEQLRPHQIEGVKFMYECVMGMRHEGQGCILADDMGLGKTIQAIALLFTLLKQNPYGGKDGVIGRVLIACPVTLIQNWSREIKKWLGSDCLGVFIADGKRDIRTFCVSKSYQVLIIGYERLRALVEELRFAQPPIGLVICDEGHRLKSAGGKTTQAFNILSAPRRIILSGTPVQNNLAELHAMVDFVNPGCLDTYSKFKKVFESVILKSRDPKASIKDRELGEQRSNKLNEEVKQMLLRREGSVIQKYLPPKLEYIVFIAPTDIELRLYQAILNGTAVSQLLNDGARTEQLSLLMVLRKLSTTPGLLMKQAKTDTGMEILTEDVTSLFPKSVTADDFALSGKLTVLGSLLKGLRLQNAEKIVIVSNFTQTLDVIQRHCEKENYPFCRLDGKTPPADRVAMVDGFNRGFLKNSFVFLLSSKSGGTGLNIIGASRLVMIDGDWNPSTDAQAMARIHRQGQTKPCVIYRFLTAGTMDEKIFQRQVTKIGLSLSFMNSESGAKADSGDAFTLDDLRKIFKVHPGVASQTHDLLECRCHLDEEPQGSGSEEDDDESEEELAGWTKASQYRPDKPSKDRKNLSLLNSYAHYSPRDQASIDEIEDTVLRGVIYDRLSESAETARAKGEDVRGEDVLRGGEVSFVMALVSSKDTPDEADA